MIGAKPAPPAKYAIEGATYRRNARGELPQDKVVREGCVARHNSRDDDVTFGNSRNREVDQEPLRRESLNSKFSTVPSPAGLTVSLSPGIVGGTVTAVFQTEFHVACAMNEPFLETDEILLPENFPVFHTPLTK